MIVEVRGAGPVVDEVLSAPVDADEPLAVVFRAHAPKLVGLARLLLDQPAQAEEVVQEAFVRTYANWRRVRNRDDPFPYVRRAVVNLARSGLRRRRTERAHRFERVLDVPSAETVASVQARHREVAAAVAALPRRQRECVVLRFYGEFSVPEIATMLRVSEGSVKQHLHRAMGALARALGEEA